MLSLATKRELEDTLFTFYPAINSIHVQSIDHQVYIKITWPWYRWLFKYFDRKKIETLFAIHGIAWIKYHITFGYEW